MIKLLLDANLSPETAVYLRKSKFDVKSLLEEGLGSLDDINVAEMAIKEERVIITFDLDFGEIFHYRSSPELSVIVLRLNDQTVESVNSRLKLLFKSDIVDKNMENTLITVSDKTVRIYKIN